MNDSTSYKQKFDLSGKVAIVTGGAGILGTRFCKGLAESGASVAVVDINANAAMKLAEFLRVTYKVNSIGIACDVSQADYTRELVSSVTNEIGDVDILLNNAAGKSDDLEAFFATFEDYSLEQWKQIMSVNIDGMFLVAQAVGKHMLDHANGGSIIQTSSIYGVVAPDQRIYVGSRYMDMEINTPAVYSVSKAAVIGLTKYLAAYWASKKIRVNTLTPGGVESGQNEAFKVKYSARVPLNRMSEPDEMVGAVLFLASDASSYVTGQNLIVDGGLSCW